MKTPLLVMLAVLVFAAAGHAPSQAASPKDPIVINQFVGGTVEKIDLVGLRLTVQTDLGKSEALPVANAGVIKDLYKGDRVSVELDDQGRVIKIVKTTPDPDAPKTKG